MKLPLSKIAALLLLCAAALPAQTKVGPRNFIPLNYRTASSLGAAMDVNMVTGAKIGGGTATDDTAVLQAYLSTASASNPVRLVMDGASAITGLTINAVGYTVIEGMGASTGFFMKSGSSNTGIQTVGADNILVSNGGSAQAAGTAPARGTNVELKNFTINGNRGTFTNGTPPVYNRDGNSSGTDWRGTTYYAFNINLTSLNNVRVDKVRSLNAPGWNIKLTNVGNAWVTDCLSHEDYGTTGAGGVVWNGDGLDIVGPSNDVHIDNFTADNCGDDGIALSAAVGWSGPISRVTINNYISTNNTAVIRILAYNQTGYNGKISDVMINNVTGSALFNGIILGYDQDAAPPSVIDWIAHVFVDNTHITAQNFMTLQADYAGSVNVSNSTFTPIESQVNQGAFNLSAGTRVGRLNLTNFTISRDASWNCYLLTVPATARIAYVAFEGVRTTMSLGSAFSDLSYGLDVLGAIDRLWIGSWDTKGFVGPVSGNDVTLITKIQGPGVTAALLTAK